MTMANKKTKTIKTNVRPCPPFKRALANFAPPENLSVSEWADKYRILPAEVSAEPGPWRTSRTPYLYEPMAAFTDPAVSRIVMVAASQVGKSEFELNVLGYIMAQAPGSVLYIQPYQTDAKKFSRQRIAPMIRDCPQLRGKVVDQKAKDGGNTLLQKIFPGGSITMAGSASAADLCSIPCRYIIGDERDRWEDSAGNEGDPWELAQARQITFYNRKAVEVSTPTIAGSSKIAASYALGTMERWEHQCPHCGAWHEITKELVAHTCDKVEIAGRTVNRITVHGFCCPDCGTITPQEIMRKQPQRWHAENPEAIRTGCRSFWLTAFASPWQPWDNIFQKLYDNLDNPEQLKVVYNTMLGKLWEDRTLDVNSDDYLDRREEYQAELPEGVLALTCGVDTQDDRLEYEVVGWGRGNESWGIRKGFISGAPDSPRVWAELDEVLTKTYRFADGYGLGISCTFIDSGGHYTEDVYKQTRARNAHRVFAIKGRGGEGIPLVNPAKKIPTKDGSSVWLYTLGVDAGKAAIMSALTVQQAGSKFCHFPLDPMAGYDDAYFKGLLSEKMERKRTASGYKWTWVKLPGHQRNEALDCRNYAYAARQSLVTDFDKIAITLAERRAASAGAPKAEQQSVTPAQPAARRSRRSSPAGLGGGEW